MSRKKRRWVTRADATGTGFNKFHAQLAVGVILDCISNGKQIQRLVLPRIAFLCYCCLKKSSWYKDYRWCNFYHYMFDFADILTKIQDELCLLFFLSKHFSSMKCKRSLRLHCFFHYGYINFNLFFFNEPISSSKSNLHSFKSQPVAIRGHILIHSHLLVVLALCFVIFPFPPSPCWLQKKMRKASWNVNGVANSYTQKKCLRQKILLASRQGLIYPYYDVGFFPNLYYLVAYAHITCIMKVTNHSKKVIFHYFSWLPMYPALQSAVLNFEVLGRRTPPAKPSWQTDRQISVLSAVFPYKVQHKMADKEGQVFINFRISSP